MKHPTDEHPLLTRGRVSRGHGEAAPRRPRSDGALSRRLCIAAIGMAAAHSMAAAAGSAVEAAPGATVLTEVTVTATKRAETVQSVPLSITAITGEAVEAAGISEFFDYGTRVPNLTFASGHGIVNGRTIAVRGVQGGDTTGFYIDDLPVPSTMDPRVVDLERIEVLRGPQGTLYGARSMGGTVRLITRAPDPSGVSGSAHATGSQIDGGGGGYQVDAAANLPVADGRAALRLTGFLGTQGGFIERSYPSSQGPAGATSTDVARGDFAGGTASFLWNVTDRFMARATVMTQSYRLNGFPLADGSENNLTQERPLDVPESGLDKWNYGGLTLSYETTVGTITSASSWFSRQADEVEDVTQQLSALIGIPYMPATMLTWQPGHSFVEELRFSSSFEGPWRVIGGLYYGTSLRNYDQLSDVPGLDDAVGGAFGSDLVFSEWHPTRSREFAVFGEVTYQLSAHWSGTIGLRSSKVERSFEENLDGLAAGGPRSNSGQTTERKMTPKFVLQYEPSTDQNYYALAAQGFRPGNAQTAPSPAFCAADYAAAGLAPADLDSYDADSLWNYEIGAKTRFLDRRLTLAAAAFWIDWSDLQQTLMFRCGYPYVANVGKARSRGAELEFSALPFEGLVITGGLGYTDAKIIETAPNAPTVAGQPVQQIAPWTVSAGVDYSAVLGGSWRGTMHVDYAYVDRSYSASNDATNPRLRPAYDIVNLRLGVTNGRYEFTAFVDNVGDTHANLGDNQSQAAELPGRPRILVNRPRTFGLSCAVRW